jgi:hypothetical protein
MKKSQFDTRCQRPDSVDHAEAWRAKTSQAVVYRLQELDQRLTGERNVGIRLRGKLREVSILRKLHHLDVRCHESGVCAPVPVPNHGRLELLDDRHRPLFFNARSMEATRRFYLVACALRDRPNVTLRKAAALATAAPPVVAYAMASVEALLRRADARLNATLPTPTDKRGAGSGHDPRSYLSLGVHSWRVADLPAKFKSRGTYWEKGMQQGMIYWDGAERPDSAIEPEQHTNYHASTDRARAYHVHLDMATLALAYYYTNDERYAAKAVDFVVAWFVDPTTSLKPHLNNSCNEKKGLNGQGAPCTIEMRDLTWVLDALACLRGSTAFEARAAVGLHAWCTSYGDWLDGGHPYLEKERRLNNNHRWYYWLQRIAIARCAGDDLAAVGAMLRKHLDEPSFNIGDAVNVLGIMPKEAARERSLHYHYFTASALILTERALRATELITRNHAAITFSHTSKAGKLNAWQPNCQVRRVEPIWRVATLLLNDSAARRTGDQRPLGVVLLTGDFRDRAERDDFICQWVHAYVNDRRVDGETFAWINHLCASYQSRRAVRPSQPTPLVPSDPHAGIVPFAELVF